MESRTADQPGRAAPGVHRSCAQIPSASPSRAERPNPSTVRAPGACALRRTTQSGCTGRLRMRSADRLPSPESERQGCRRTRLIGYPELPAPARLLTLTNDTCVREIVAPYAHCGSPRPLDRMEVI